MAENGAKLLLSVREAAALLGVGRGLVYEMVAQNRLPHLRVGRLVKISRQGLENWIAQESGADVAANGGTVVDLAQPGGDSTEADG